MDSIREEHEKTPPELEWRKQWVFPEDAIRHLPTVETPGVYRYTNGHEVEIRDDLSAVAISRTGAMSIRDPMSVSATWADRPFDASRYQLPDELAIGSLSFGQAALDRERRATMTGPRKERRVVLSKGSPLTNAERYVLHRHVRLFGDQDRERAEMLTRWAGAWWTLDRGQREEIPHADVETALLRFMSSAVQKVKTKEGTQTLDFDPNDADLRKAMKMLTTRQNPGATRPAPFWLVPEYEERFGDVSDCAVFENAVVRIEGQHARVLEGAQCPALFAPNVIPREFDPDAPAPVAWIAWLEDRFADDPGSIQALQEYMGLLLTTDTSYQRMLVIRGRPGSGKSTLLRTIGALVGRHNTCSPTIRSLPERFGLSGMVGKSVALISDASFAIQSSQRATEIIKAITGEDEIRVEKKHCDPIDVKLGIRLVIASNDQMALVDGAGALERRTLALTMDRPLPQPHDPTVENKIMAELPQITRWAIEGLARLRRNREFSATPQMIEARQAMRGAGSPLVSFADDVLVLGQVDPHDAPTLDEVYTQFKGWAWRNDERPRSRDVFSRDLQSAVPEVRSHRVNVVEDGRRTKKTVLLGIARVIPGPLPVL